MELVNLKIELDNLRLALDEAFDKRRSLTELKFLNRAIKKKELEIKKHFLISN